MVCGFFESEFILLVFDYMASKQDHKQASVFNLKVIKLIVALNYELIGNENYVLFQGFVRSDILNFYRHAYCNVKEIFYS